MSKIDYQALREAAERAIPAMERLLMLPVDDDLISEQELKDYGVDIDALNAFKFLTGPETVLALLDERERNQQYIKRRDQENEDIALTVGKLRVELEAAKKRIAELEAELVSQTYKLNELSGNSPVTPDGWVMVPKKLTAENGAKGALSGEFSETTVISCPECFGDDDCDTCDGSGRIEIKVPVTWATIKSIWDKGIAYFAAEPLQEVNRG
ncbi:ead/Ea22-like family protein [Escherichia coli]|nr:ead/Ea22-like family protein [Escherichia coli]EGO8379406.1 ead/Ea22-like family protein [Escherichia coli]